MYLRHPDPSSDISQVVWASRVPRTVLTVIMGAALGVAGALIQALTRNPLADPGILGVNAGAAFSIVLSMLFFQVSSFHSQMWFALLGAFATSGLVFLIAGSRRYSRDPVRVTLIGVALAAILTATTSALLFFNPSMYVAMRSWSAGTLATQPLSVVTVTGPIVAIGLVLALAIYRSLDVLSLGEATAITMGVKPGRLRLVGLIALTLLTGAATAACGPIAFLGLLAVHTVRPLVGAHQGWIMLYCLVTAPLIMAVSDVLGRIIIAGEVPVGMVTPALGAPLLVMIVRRLQPVTA